MRRILRFVITILIFALFSSLCSFSSLAEESGSLSNFTKLQAYTNDQFSDVKSYHWYSEYVKTTYEYGLMNGVSATNFDANGNLSMASVITIADRIHDIYYNMKSDFNSNRRGPWYQQYIDYAINNGIISEDDQYDYTANCSRAEFAFIIAKALPKSEFLQKNYITDIPDVSESSFAYDDILMLYRAGVLAGNDIYGTYTPEASITRGAVAAILTRIIDVDTRLNTKLEIKAESIIINSRKILIPWLSIGESYKPQFIIEPTNTTETASWTSSDPTIATVKDGVITTLKEGYVTITGVLPSGIKDTMSFYVESDIELANIALKALKISIVEVPGVNANDLEVKSVWIGTRNMYAIPQIVACVTYSDSITNNIRSLLVWHVSVEMNDGYYYEESNAHASDSLQSKRNIDLGLLKY